METCSSLEQEVYGSDLRLVKLNTVLPMAHHNGYSSSKQTVLLSNNDTKIGLPQLVTHYGMIQRML